MLPQDLHVFQHFKYFCNQGHIKYCKTKKGRITKTSQNSGNNNKNFLKNNRTTTLERTAAESTGGLNKFTDQIFALDSAVIKTQNVLSWREGFLFIYNFIYCVMHY